MSKTNRTSWWTRSEKRGIKEERMTSKLKSGTAVPVKVSFIDMGKDGGRGQGRLGLKCQSDSQVDLVSSGIYESGVWEMVRAMNIKL